MLEDSPTLSLIVDPLGGLDFEAKTGAMANSQAAANARPRSVDDCSVVMGSPHREP